MSSWCVIASPPHGKVCGVFYGLRVFLMLHVHVAPLLLLSHVSHVHPFVKKYPHMFVSSRKYILACSSLHENISSHASSISEKNLLTYIVCSRENILACIVHSSIREQISLHVLSLFIPSVITSCLIHVPVFEITHDEMTSNP